MLKLFILILLVLLQAGTDPGSKGEKSGRAGNKAYETERYDVATEHYQAGLSEMDEIAQGSVTHGLFNNLGSALYRQQSFDEAQTAFERAILSASSNEDMARAAYNAGNNAFRRQDMEAALEFYKSALLSDPDNLDAKYNYELVRRMMENRQDQQAGKNRNEPQQEEQEQNNEQDEQSQEQQEGEQEQQEQQQEERRQNEGEEQPESPPRPDPNELTREQAERILEALQMDEKDLLREVMKMNARPRRVEKDW